MITKHCQRRMKERNVTEKDLIEAMRKGTWGKNWMGADTTRIIRYKDIRVVVDMHGRDILTTWRVERD